MSHNNHEKAKQDPSQLAGQSAPEPIHQPTSQLTNDKTERGKGSANWYAKLHPKYIPAWCAVAFTIAMSWLPMSIKQRWGAWFGRLIYRKMPSRTKVTRKNIELCFPDLATTEQEAIVQGSYVACTRGFFESAHAWWRNVDRYVDNVKINGLEHLNAAQINGKGILLIGGHYSIFDFALPLIAHQLDKPGYMYRPNDNPVLDWMVERGRRRHCGIQGFHKYELPKMVEFLQSGGTVWYACDQDFGRRRTKVFVPFFGVQAGCITMPSKVIRDSGAQAMCVSHIRLDNGQYELNFSPVLQDFGQDDEADALAWNQFLEDALRQHPEQYLWMHQRFKTRPEGEEKVYRKN